jgi:Uma2 family endonuclease
MVVRERLYSAEEFFEIARQPENEDRRLELDEGVIVEMASSTRLNAVTASRIGYFLNAFVIPHDLGYVIGADGGYKLGERRARQPDVAFISKARAGKLKGVAFDGGPDLAVEVVSEDENVLKKAQEYFRAGTRLVWAVYADEKIVYVMTLDEDGRTISTPHKIGDTLDGGDVLPDFRLAVRDIFPDHAPR